MNWWKKFLGIIALLTLVIGVAVAAPKEATAFAGATPAWADLDRFPVMTGPLSVGQMANLGLFPTTIGANTVMYNHRRNLHQGGGFELETLLSGTLVLMDSSGRIRYKADCGNRLVEQLPPAPNVEIVRVGNNASSAVSKELTSADQPKGFVQSWKNLGQSAKSEAKILWNEIGTAVAPIGWSFVWLLGLALVISVLFGLFAVARAWVRRL